jgi:hypothetical protein
MYLEGRFVVQEEFVLRIGIAVLALAATLLAVSLNSEAATTLNMSDLHISMEIPTGWTYERNSSSGGVIYDLEIQGPVSGGYQPYGLLDHSRWPGTVSDSSLWAEMKKERDDIRNDPEASYVVIASPATNGTINGTKSCDMTMLMTYSGVSVKERIVILASSDWNMGWKLAIACVNAQWTTYSSQIDTMISSMTVEEKTSTEMSMVYVGVGLLVVVVVVILIVVMVMRDRGKRDDAMLMTPPPVPPQMQPPYQAPMQPPYQPPMQPPPPPPNP